MSKRLFDIVFAALGFVILLPVFVIIALVNKFSSPGPIFYRAERVGQYGKHFKLYKFRTMVVNADKIGPKITGSNDARVTLIGRFLRRHKLDELPQLINVLKGEMSFVGPRPEDPRYILFYAAEQKKVLNVKPGITSLASLEYCNEETLLTTEDWESQYINEVLPAKLEIELKYTKAPSLRKDITIILNTLIRVVKLNY